MMRRFSVGNDGPGRHSNIKPKARSASRGFTFVELLIVITLLMVIIAIGMPLKTNKDKVNSKTAAETIAAEMRQLRQKASAQNMPTALCFPTDNGTNPVSQSYYVMEGDSAVMTKSVNLAPNNPSTYIFNGYWNINPSLLRDSTKTTTVKQPAPASNSDTFDACAWGPQAPDVKAKDFAFVFMPSGTIKTNGLPLYDGDFHVVVTQAVAYETGGSLPSAMNDDGVEQCCADLSTGSFFRMTKAYRPYTITISPLGNITVTEGIPGVDNTCVEITANSFPTKAAAAPRSMQRTPNHNPTIDSVVIEPMPDASQLPSGVDCTINGKDHLSLTVKASDIDGDALYCQWSCPQGAFDDSRAAKMIWSSSEKKWTILNHWKAPADAPVNTLFTLKCVVTDGKGGSAEKQIIVKKIPKYRMSFIGLRSGKMQWSYDDGSQYFDMDFYDDSHSHDNARFTPDGKRMFYDCNGVIYSVYSDGTGERQMVSVPGWSVFCPSINATGTKIVCVGTSANGSPTGPPADPPYGQLFTANIDGSNATRITHPGWNIGPNYHYTASCCNMEWLCGMRVPSSPEWSPDGSLIAFYGNCWDNVSYLDSYWYICLVRPDGLNPDFVQNRANSVRCLTNTKSNDYGYIYTRPPDTVPIRWSRDSQWIYASNFKIRPNGTGKTTLTVPGSSTVVSLSSDEIKILFWDKSSTIFWVSDLINTFAGSHLPFPTGQGFLGNFIPEE